jgi:nucleoside-triphosphatase THEP1
MKQITDVLNGIYNNPELRRTCIPLFLSDPGEGKSQCVQKFVDDLGVNMVKIVASTRMPNEVGGCQVPDYAVGKMTTFDYDLFLSLKDGDVIMFDELLNTNIMVLNACLTILEERTLLSGKKLPDIMIVAAANRQGATILTPQIKERFIWYDVQNDKVSWGKYMVDKYQVTQDIVDGLWNLIRSETFVIGQENYLSCRSVDKAVNMMIKSVPTPYEKKIGAVLNTMVENTSTFDIPIGDYIFKPSERKPWLEIQKLMKNATTTKQ